MHVLFTLDSLEIGGTELNAVRTARELIRRGHRVTVAHLSPSGTLLKEYTELGAELLALPVFGLASWSSLQCSVRLYLWLRRHRPDVVHAQDVYANIFSIPVAKAAKVRTVVASRRWVSELARPSLASANRIASRLAHRVSANSPSALLAVASDLGSKSRNARYVPNFIDVQRFSLADVSLAKAEMASVGIPLNEPIIGCVAQLRPVKRHDLLLRSFAEASQTTKASLVLIGDGPERRRLESLARELEISDRVFFRGAIRSSRNLHLGFDVSILLSDCEASPNSLLEAAAAGVPIIATRVGGIQDIFSHEESALLTVPGDSTSAADSIIRLLLDSSLRSSLIRAGLKLAERFSPEHTLDALLDCYAGGRQRERVVSPIGASLTSTSQ